MSPTVAYCGNSPHKTSFLNSSFNTVPKQAWVVEYEISDLEEGVDDGLEGVGEAADREVAVVLRLQHRLAQLELQQRRAHLQHRTPGIDRFIT